MIPNLTGLNISEKIEVIRKTVNTLIQFKNELPVGMTVLRRDEKDNAGFNYGKWILLDDKVTTENGILIIYIRVE